MDAQQLISDLFSAVTSGKYMIAGAMFVIFLVSLLKTDFVTKKVPALKKSGWVWTSAIVTGALGGVATAIIAGQPLGGTKGVVLLLFQGAQVGLVAAGLVKGKNILTEKKAE